jgi:hypothetical protein
MCQIDQSYSWDVCMGHVWGTKLSFNVVNLLYDLMIHRPSSDMILVTWCLVIKEDCHLSDGNVWSILLCE